VHASTEDKSDEKKDDYYEELECVLDQFPKSHIKNPARKFRRKRRKRIYPQINNRKREFT